MDADLADIIQSKNDHKSVKPTGFPPCNEVKLRANRATFFDTHLEHPRGLAEIVRLFHKPMILG